MLTEEQSLDNKDALSEIFRKDKLLMHSSLLIFFLLLIPLLWQAYSDRKTKPVYELFPSQWKVYFPKESDSFDCSEETTNKKPEDLCIGNPKNPKLWKSQVDKSLPEYEEKAKVPNAFYWMGTVISAQDLRQIYSKGANQLVLGLIQGSFEIWLNGKMVYNGNSNNSSYPAIIPLPIDKLEKQDLFIALLLINENSSGRVEVSEYSDFKNGFYKTTHFDRVLHWKAFKNQSIHVFFVGIFLIFGFFFYSLHLMQPLNLLFLPATQLAFTHGVFHLLYIDIVHRLLAMDIWLNLVSGISIVLSLLILRFALVFSKTKSVVAQTVFYLAFVSFFGSLLLNNTPLLYQISDFSFRFLSPACFLMGAAILFFKYLGNKRLVANANKEKNQALRETMWLFFWGGAMVVLQTQGRSQVVLDPILGVNITVLILFYFAVQSIKMLQNKIELSDKLPVSEFHKRSFLPPMVEGTLLMLDLKKSESLFRKGAEWNRGGSLTSILITNICNHLTEAQATIIQAEGDAVVVLWEKEKHVSSVAILKALVSLEELLDLLSQQLSETELQVSGKIAFRGALVEGAIKPIWRELGSERIPAWIEAGDKNVFVDASRLLSIEGESFNSALSQVMCLSGGIDTHQSPDSLLGRGWVQKNVKCLGKHNASYTVSVFQPSQVIIVDSLRPASSAS